VQPSSAGGSRHVPEPLEFAGHPVKHPAVALHILHPSLDIEIEAFKRGPQVMGQVATLAVRGRGLLGLKRRSGLCGESLMLVDASSGNSDAIALS